MKIFIPIGYISSVSIKTIQQSGTFTSTPHWVSICIFPQYSIRLNTITIRHSIGKTKK